MPKKGQTGVVIPVPEAEPLLRSVAQRFPSAAREGVPAHVSVLYPFLSDEAVDDEVVDALSDVFAAQRRIAVTFAESRREGDFVALRPDPIDDLRELTARVRRRWPDVVPYEGAYGEVEPHLTVALHAGEHAAAVVERDVVPELLPIPAELGEAWLVAFECRWNLRRRFVFGEG